MTVWRPVEAVIGRKSAARLAQFGICIVLLSVALWITGGSLVLCLFTVLSAKCVGAEPRYSDWRSFRDGLGLAIWGYAEMCRWGMRFPWRWQTYRALVVVCIGLVDIHYVVRRVMDVMAGACHGVLATGGAVLCIVVIVAGKVAIWWYCIQLGRCVVDYIERSVVFRDLNAMEIPKPTE